MVIPEWASNGFIPPIDQDSPTELNRSPYKVDIIDFATRFNKSPERYKILNGFLNFRNSLHKLGFTKGFQWVDGSFMEDVERIENRSPGDIDVVTFIYFPDSIDQRKLFSSNPELFNRNETKKCYSVDSFFVNLTVCSAEYLIERSRYWYSMWSHNRIGQWKGYLELDLGNKNDEIAMKSLGV